MKILSFLILVFALVVAAHADEKIDVILDAYSVKEDFLVLIEESKPTDFLALNSRDSTENDEMFARHYRENLEVFNKYISWENFKPYFVSELKNIFSEEEIDAFYEFAKSEHGASFFSKNMAVGQSFLTVYSNIFALYRQEESDLYDMHQQEVGKRMAELEKAEQEAVAPGSEPKTPNIRDIVRFMVTTENGQMVGFKVGPGRRPELFEKSPFQEDDIVLSMNGIVVNEPSKVRDAYQMLKDFPQVHFEVRRNRRLVDFVIDINELAGIDG